MTDMKYKWNGHLRREMDETLFSKIELNEEMKRKIRQQAAAEKMERRFFIPRRWLTSAAALVAAVAIVVAYPMLQQSNAPAPEASAPGNLPSANEGSVGSGISELITTPLGSVEEAKASFGSELLVPNAAPEGFTLSEMVAVGMKDEPARDVNITYVSGDKTVTFSASRLPAAFPTELFTPTKVGGADGFIFEQPELTELYWVKDGIQYGLIAQLSAEETMKIAESVTP